MNKLEILNEITISFLSYLTFGFSDYKVNPDAKFRVGWAYCIIILLNFFVNTTFTGYMTLKNTGKKCMRKKKVKKEAVSLK